MKLLVIFSVLVVASKISGLHFFPEIALKFLELHKLNNGILFYCEKSYEKWPEMAKSEFKYLTFNEISSFKVKSNDASVLMRLHSPRIAVIFDTSCNGTEELFKTFSNTGSFNGSYFWLMLADDYETAIELLSLQDINLDAEITLAIDRNNETFEIFDVYNPNSRSNNQLIVQSKGFWKQDNGFNLQSNSSKFEKRSNLNGAVFRAAVIAHPKNQTLVSFLKTEDKLEDLQSRYHFNLFEILQKRHNFR